MDSNKIIELVISLLEDSTEWACEAFGNNYRNMVTLDDELKDELRALPKKLNGATVSEVRGCPYGHDTDNCAYKADTCFDCLPVSSKPKPKR